MDCGDSGTTSAVLARSDFVAEADFPTEDGCVPESDLSHPLVKIRPQSTSMIAVVPRRQSDGAGFPFSDFIIRSLKVSTDTLV